MREKGNQQAVINERFCGANMPAVNVDRVGDSYECVERNSERENDARSSRVVFDAERMDQRSEIPKQKIAVFEIAEDSKVRGQADQQNEALFRFILGREDPFGDEPVDQRDQPQQQDERRVPCCVEYVAGDY